MITCVIVLTDASQVSPCAPCHVPNKLKQTFPSLYRLGLRRHRPPPVVLNLIFGAQVGYPLGKNVSNVKKPASYGVSSGPVMPTLQSTLLSSSTLTSAVLDRLNGSVAVRPAISRATLTKCGPVFKSRVASSRNACFRPVPPEEVPLGPAPASPFVSLAPGPSPSPDTTPETSNTKGRIATTYAASETNSSESLNDVAPFLPSLPPGLPLLFPGLARSSPGSSLLLPVLPALAVVFVVCFPFSAVSRFDRLALDQIQVKISAPPWQGRRPQHQIKMPLMLFYNKGDSC